MSSCQTTKSRGQVEAIIDAAITVIKEGRRVYPEIMIPLVCSERELDFILPMVRSLLIAK
jgi:phosphoenolpyruvate synthase/pyruvate phosphate dikinase